MHVCTMYVGVWVNIATYVGNTEKPYTSCLLSNKSAAFWQETAIKRTARCCNE